jgi:NADH dehydrogenase (ubiquinone) 1 alpha subcomplex subunit 5
LSFRVQDIERKIGAGLIEEIVEVAEGELKLVETMQKSKVWEDLEDKAPEGQWTYFERKSA